MQTFMKLRPLGDAECAGILDGTVYIYEKYDGANARVSIENGQLTVGGRNHQVPCDGQEFQSGLGTYMYSVRDQVTPIIRKWSERLGGEITLFGEWMQKHTVDYSITKPYVIFYDAHVVGRGHVPHETRQQILDELEEAGLAVAVRLAVLENPTPNDLSQFVARKSLLRPEITAEGYVVYNPAFVNQYGRQIIAKMVNDEFREVAKVKKVYKDSAGAYQDYSILVETYVSRRRIEKLLLANNLEPTLKSMTVLSKVVVADILQEHILDLYQQVAILDFALFNKQVCMRTVRHLQTWNIIHNVTETTVNGEDNDTAQ